MRRLRFIVSIIIVFIVSLGGSAMGETKSSPLFMTLDLASLLDDNSFFPQLLKTDIDYEINFLGMCNGGLLPFCTVSSDYGWRVHPVRRYKHFHTGIDLKAPGGTFIFAPADGIVKIAGWGQGYGRMVELDHGYSWNTKYGHMKKIYVKKGQIIRKGDLLGEVGSTGTTTGAHLHFETLYFNSAVNPRDYFSSLVDVRKPFFASANR